MKKLLLSTVIIAIGANAWADDILGESDLNQARPPATVSASNVATIVTTTTQSGDDITTTTEEIMIADPNTVISISTPESALPPAVIVDPDMDMEKTMKMMGKNFKALNKASTLEEMVEPAEQLAVYAGQAYAMGEHAPEEVREDFLNGMEKLRVEIAELQASIAAGDLDGARAMLQILDEHKDMAHEYFEVED